MHLSDFQMRYLTCGILILMILVVCVVMKIKWHKLNIRIDSYYTKNILRNAEPNCKILDTSNECLSLVRFKLYSRVFVDKPKVLQIIREILSTGEDYSYKFKHLYEFIEGLNCDIESYNCKSKIQYTYNKNNNTVRILFLTSKIESEIKV